MWTAKLKEYHQNICEGQLTNIKPDTNTTLSGTQLMNAIQQVTQSVQTSINEKSTVMLCIEDPIKHITLFNALLCHNCCVISVEYTDDCANHCKTIKNCAVSHFISDDKRYFESNKEHNALKELNQIHVNDSHEVELFHRFDTEINGQQQKQYPSAIYRSSGSTGQPKHIILTAQGIIDVIEKYMAELKETKSTSILSILPLSAIYPMSICLAVLFSGKKLTLGDPVKRPLNELIAFNQADVLPGVPLLVEKLHDKIYDSLNQTNFIVRHILNGLTHCSFFVRKHTGLNLGRAIFFFIHNITGPSLKIILSGGATLSVSILKSMHGLGYTIYEGYGITEACGMVSIRKNNLYDLGTTGKPLDDCNVKLTDDQEIMIKTNRLFTGYLSNNKVETFHDQWFATGDLGSIDKRGNISIVGRTKDIIVLANESKILPSVIESKLETINEVAPFIVLGVIDKNTSGDAIIVVAQCTDQHKQNQITDIINQTNLPDLQKPNHLYFIKEFPRTMLGKIDRFQVKQQINKMESITI